MILNSLIFFFIKYLLTKIIKHYFICLLFLHKFASHRMDNIAWISKLKGSVHFHPFMLLICRPQTLGCTFRHPTSLTSYSWLSSEFRFDHWLQIFQDVNSIYKCVAHAMLLHWRPMSNFKLQPFPMTCLKLGFFLLYRLIISVSNVPLELQTTEDAVWDLPKFVTNQMEPVGTSLKLGFINKEPVTGFLEVLLDCKICMSEDCAPP